MIGASIPAPAWVRHVAPWATNARVRVLGEQSGHPHVVLLPPDPAAAERRVVKRYRDESGAAAAAAMQEVRAALATVDRPVLAVPTPTAWHARERVLAQTAGGGRPLLPLLRSPSWRQAAVAAGEALACLHTLPYRQGHVTTLADQVQELIHPAPMIAVSALPDLAERVTVVEREVRARGSEDPSRPVAIHRDAHARQMLLDGPRVWLVDWDLSARGEAALDVANFIVYVRTHVARRGRAAGDVFLSAYCANAPDPSTRLAVYTAFTYLRLVSKACRLRTPGWRHRAERYVARAEAALTA